MTLFRNRPKNTGAPKGQHRHPTSGGLTSRQRLLSGGRYRSVPAHVPLSLQTSLCLPASDIARPNAENGAVAAPISRRSPCLCSAGYRGARNMPPQLLCRIWPAPLDVTVRQTHALQIQSPQVPHSHAWVAAPIARVMFASGLSSESPIPMMSSTPLRLVISSAGMFLPHAAHVAIALLLFFVVAERLRIRRGCRPSPASDLRQAWTRSRLSSWPFFRPSFSCWHSCFSCRCLVSSIILTINSSSSHRFCSDSFCFFSISSAPLLAASCATNVTVCWVLSDYGDMTIVPPHSGHVNRQVSPDAILLADSRIMSPSTGTVFRHRLHGTPRVLRTCSSIAALLPASAF